MTDSVDHSSGVHKLRVARYPVSDWMTDFDHYDPKWVSDPFRLWAEMRAVRPVAKTPRYCTVHCPLTQETVRAVALDTQSFSSRFIDIRENQVLPPDFAPPITSDPPDHRPLRAILAPAFTGRAIERFERPVREHCRTLLARMKEHGTADAVAGYARLVPANCIGTLLGVPAGDVIAFQDWSLVERQSYIERILAERLAAPGEDLVSLLLAGQRSGETHYAGGAGGTLFLLLIAGVDTTAAVISAGLLHLAGHAEDAARLRADHALIPSAVQEFLRAFAPVSSARVATRPARIGDTDVAGGEMVLLAFAAANRDPARFSAPDQVILDRGEKGHLAFGFGIHRCLGANLAEMLVGAAIGEWLDNAGGFRVAEGQCLSWTSGNVRGLKSLVVEFDGMRATGMPLGEDAEAPRRSATS